MNLKSTSKEPTVYDRLLSTAHPDLVAAAFSAAAMAALAKHYGSNAAPSIAQRYSEVSGDRLGWEVLQTQAPGFGSLDGAFRLILIKAGFIGAQIGLTLQDGDSLRDCFHRVQSRSRELIQYYRRYGIQPEQTAASKRGSRQDMLVLYTLLMRYESQIIGDSTVLITAAIKAVARWPAATFRMRACTPSPERGALLSRSKP